MKELFSWVAKNDDRLDGVLWVAIEKGGSDRRFWRGMGEGQGFIAVAYGREKPENARYADCTDFLKKYGVNVPKVLAHEEAEGFLLLEDVGSDDLWKYREDSWEVRRALYVEGLKQVAMMHRASLTEASAANVLQAPFGDELYRWEQDYFFTYFLEVESDDAEKLKRLLPLQAQAKELASRSRVLLHRDFQSQNVIVRNGRVTLIDFQGMRAGLAGYDVASLLYDPYVVLSERERAELIEVYRELMGRSDDASWESEFQACARQRLMQALGAYGFLGRIKGKSQFLEYIPIAAERLAMVCEHAAGWEALAESLRQVVKKKE